MSTTHQPIVVPPVVQPGVAPVLNLGSQMATVPSQAEAAKPAIHGVSPCACGGRCPRCGGEVGRGTPLAEPLRNHFESRFGEDLGRVRIHETPAAGAVARRENAKAFTRGDDVVIDPSQARDPQERMKLLTHELTHVLQQQKAGPDRGGAAGAGRASEAEAERNAELAGSREPLDAVVHAPRGQIQRQSTTQTGTGANRFSVDTARYASLLNQAISGMSGGLLEANTAAGFVRPLLQAMAANVTWRDANGGVMGGGAVSYTLPGTSPALSLRLGLVLDDVGTPTDSGRFQPNGLTDGTLSIRIRNNLDADTLALTLYHEAMHIVAWLTNRPGAPVLSGVNRDVSKAMTMSRFGTQISTIRRYLGLLADSVNSQRGPAEGQISPVGLERMAQWLMEEVQVRSQTHVFGQFQQVQRNRAQGGAQVFIDNTESAAPSLGIVDKYVFEFGSQFGFAETDRANLDALDRNRLNDLAGILAGFFNLQVKRQFSLMAYATGTSRPRVEWSPLPLESPIPRPERWEMP